MQPLLMQERGRPCDISSRMDRPCLLLYIAEMFFPSQQLPKLNYFSIRRFVNFLLCVSFLCLPLNEISSQLYTFSLTSRY